MKSLFKFFDSPVYSNKKDMGRMLLFITFCMQCACWMVMLFTGRELSSSLMDSVKEVLTTLLIYEGYKKARTVVNTKLNPGAAARAERN